MQKMVTRYNGKYEIKWLEIGINVKNTKLDSCSFMQNYKNYKNRLTQKRKTDTLVLQKHDNRLTCKVFKDEKVNNGLEEEK